MAQHLALWYVVHIPHRVGDVECVERGGKSSRPLVTPLSVDGYTNVRLAGALARALYFSLPIPIE